MATNRTKRMRGAAGLALVLGALPGCDFDTRNPRAVTEAELGSVGAVVALVNGVIGDYDQSFHRTVLLSGLLSDEIRASGTWPAWTQADVQGVIDRNAPLGDGQNIAHDWWGPLQRARHLAEETHGRVQLLVPNPERSPLTALTRLYSGLAYRDIGEYFCVATYDGGPAVAREESLRRAREHLSEAIVVAAAAGADSIGHMARLARARVHLSLGDADEALADASAVPNGFRWTARYADNPEEFNQAWVVLNQLAQATVHESFAGGSDPRVVVVRNGLALDRLTPRWDQQKFAKHGTMAVGTWQEARLIEAEVLLSRGQVAEAVARLNAVRAAAGLAPLSADLPAGEANAALRRERRHELFLEGQRMLDMRRWHEFPAAWGAACVPLPLAETQNNPNL